MNRQSLIFLFSLCLLGLPGCAGKIETRLDFNPLEPIRVVVLPFVELDEHGKINAQSPDLLVDRVNLVSSRLEASPAEIVKQMVEANLERTALEILPAGVVQGELIHHGLTQDDGSLDLARLYSVPPSEICRHLISCDAVLYGYVTKWKRDYFGLQAVNTVGLRLTLVTRDDQKVIFQVESEDSDSRGLSKGPTGISNLVIEPVRGLDNEIILDLARRLVTKSLLPLAVTQQPGYLKSPVPAIFGAAHDQADGVLQSGEHLVVLMFGTPYRKASFSIGRFVENIPMFEVEPSQYVGEYFPLDSDRFEEQSVSVALRDDFGRKTTQQASARLVSRLR